MDYASQKAPAQIGQSTSVKAIDETAQIVMEDYGMTDLRTDVRPGETATPKLPPAMQAAADGMFAPNVRKMRTRFNPARSVRAALTGQLRDPRAVNPIAQLHAEHEPGDPPVVARVIASDQTGRR